MTTEQTIPLNQLIHSKANVRRTAKTEGIAELAASIEAHGLRQNLNVLPVRDGRKFEVVAGSRRLRALKQLAKAGKLAKDIPIPCFVLGAGEDPAEISLAENAIRAAIHPDDQFEAFRALIEEKGATARGCRRPLRRHPRRGASAPETRPRLARSCARSTARAK